MGRVARRYLGTASAVASRSAKRVRANSRLRVCERSSWAIATTRGPTRASIRSRCVAVSVSDACTSKLASTREAVTLACCPPGPEERLARVVTSDNGIARSSVTLSVRLRFLSVSLNALVGMPITNAGCAGFLRLRWISVHRFENRPITLIPATGSSDTILSVLTRLAIILTFIAIPSLLAACGSSSHPAPTAARQTASTSSPHKPPVSNAHTGAVEPLTKANAIAFAHAVNLKPTDVPGFLATSRHEHEHETPAEKRLQRELMRCTSGALEAHGGLAKASSKNFKLERGILRFSVNSEVSVTRTSAIAAKELMAIRSSHVRACLSHYLKLLLQNQFRGGEKSRAILNPNSISLSIAHGTPPAPGATGSFGWRITATITVHNVKLRFYIDILGFVNGRAEVSLFSSGVLRPFPAAIQEHLYWLLLKRAEAHST